MRDFNEIFRMHVLRNVSSDTGKWGMCAAGGVFDAHNMKMFDPFGNCINKTRRVIDQ